MWSSVLISWRIFQFVLIHTDKGFGIVNKAEIDVFLELSCFFHDPTDVGNLVSGSSAFPKTSLNNCKFTVHVLLKPNISSTFQITLVLYHGLQIPWHNSLTSMDGYWFIHLFIHSTNTYCSFSLAHILGNVLLFLFSGPYTGKCCIMERFHHRTLLFDSWPAFSALGYISSCHRPASAYQSVACKSDEDWGRLFQFCFLKFYKFSCIRKPSWYLLLNVL